MGVFPFPDKVASREELAKDVLYKKIPESDREIIVERAWDTGVAAAVDLFAKYGTDQSIEEIVTECGLAVERVAKDNVVGKMRYFSEYYSGRNKIVLYTDSIDLWAKANEFSISDAEELILAHEFYHFLECTSLGLTSNQYRVATIKIGKWPLCLSGIQALSEIGAHGFARAYYELKGKLGKEAISKEAKIKRSTAENSK